MAKMPYPIVWAVCFFGMLFCLGITSEVALVETICTSIYDQWPATRKFKWLVALCCCLFLYACGAIMATESGIFWFTVFDMFCASTSACVVITAETLIFMYIYGYSNFRQDVYEMFGKPADDSLVSVLFGPTTLLWGFCWKVITPALGLVVLVFTIMRDELTVQHRSETYVYPQWATYFGWFLSLVPLVPIPVYFVANAIRWRREGLPFSSMFTIQPSLVSYQRIIKVAEHGIKPKDYETNLSVSFSAALGDSSVPSETNN